MRLIPAIDIIGGKCVRLSRGEYHTSKVYSENPLEVAKSFQDHGLKYLHLVDLDGAAAGRVVNFGVLEEIAAKTGLHIDFGGGVKTDADLKRVFECGAQQVIGGSIAVKDPQRFTSWIETYGAARIILGADVHTSPAGNKIAVAGWKESSEEELVPFIRRYLSQGVEYVVCTDISKDGMLAGPGKQLYQEILSQPGMDRLKLIASGGVSDFNDLVALKTIGCEGAIIGKAIYEGRILLKQLEDFS